MVLFVNILSWLVIGVVGGLFAYFVSPTKKEALPGMLAAGIVGAFTGGVFYSIIRIGTLAVAIDPIASLAAIFAAIFILNLIQKTMPLEEDFLSNKDVNLD